MLKVFLGLIKKVLFSILFLYSYNLIVASVGVIIPINFITVGVFSILGVPSLFGFVLISILMF